MPRTVDPERHEARRLVIIDAALTEFSERGYEATTTAAICRRARIGSGTLFHYFPTKLSILLAILEYGTQEVQENAAVHAANQDARDALLEIVAQSADDAADPRMPGFVRAVAGIMNEPAVTTALAAETAAQRGLLVPLVERAQRQGQVRDDLPAERITSWLVLFMDGFLERAAVDDDFTAKGEKDLLLQTAAQFLAGPR